MRELRDADAERVAELFVETFGEARRLDAEEIRSWLRNAELQPSWLRVLEADGRVVGYGDIWPEDDSLDADVAAPGHWDAFFDWAEEEARTRSIPRVRTHVADGHELERVVEARGYRLWRSSFTMETDLDDPVRPELPDARAYREEDAEPLRAALNEAFSGDPFWHPVSESNFREFFLGARGFDPSLWLLAWDGDELAGFSLAYPERAGDATLGWIGTLGVRPRWRRRGLGEALLRASFHDLHARGLRRAGLGVDAENVTGALRLYERVGMRQVRRQNTWAKEL